MSLGLSFIVSCNSPLQSIQGHVANLVESTNKILMKITKHIIDDNTREWHLQLTHAFGLIGQRPQLVLVRHIWLVYGQEAIIPTKLEITTYWLAFHTKELDNSLITHKFKSLIALEELWEFATHNLK